MTVKVGVLALQGDFEAHAVALTAAGAIAIEVRTTAELESVDALVIPGGESTTIRKLAVAYGLLEPLRARAASGMPILGTCAGMIACATTIADGDEPIIPVVDITVRRNAYGRQAQSFEADIDFEGVGEVRAVFIRAPRIEHVGNGVEVLATHNGEPVAVRQGNALLDGRTEWMAAWRALPGERRRSIWRKSAFNMWRLRRLTNQADIVMAAGLISRRIRRLPLDFAVGYAIVALPVWLFSNQGPGYWIARFAVYGALYFVGSLFAYRRLRRQLLELAV